MEKEKFALLKSELSFRHAYGFELDERKISTVYRRCTQTEKHLFP
jgi:hypothetical protein